MRCTYTLSFSFCARGTHFAPFLRRETAADIRAYIGISSYREPFYLMYDPVNAIDKTGHLSLTLYGDRLSLLRLLSSSAVTGETHSADLSPSVRVPARPYRREKLICILFSFFLPLFLSSSPSRVSDGNKRNDRDPRARWSDRSGGINDSVRRRSQFVSRRSPIVEGGGAPLSLPGHKI